LYHFLNLLKKKNTNNLKKLKSNY